MKTRLTFSKTVF